MPATDRPMLLETRDHFASDWPETIVPDSVFEFRHPRTLATRDQNLERTASTGTEHRRGAVTFEVFVIDDPVVCAISVQIKVVARKPRLSFEGIAGRCI
jgi:hypothetical protein